MIQWLFMDSDQPFGAMARGNLINVPFTGAEARNEILEIVRIEHIIWKTGEQMKHKICVFTNWQSNDRASRQATRA
jgi:hypothetical protein